MSRDPTMKALLGDASQEKNLIYVEIGGSRVYFEDLEEAFQAFKALQPLKIISLDHRSDFSGHQITSFDFPRAAEVKLGVERKNIYPSEEAAEKARDQYKAEWEKANGSGNWN